MTDPLDTSTLGPIRETPPGMREWCDEAGLPQCTAHGLRKAMARRLADDNATQQAIKAVGGW